jgi:hypothetical protein
MDFVEGRRENVRGVGARARRILDIQAPTMAS